MTVAGSAAALTKAINDTTKELDITEASLDAKVTSVQASEAAAGADKAEAEGYRDTTAAHAASVAGDLTTVQGNVTYQGISAILAEKAVTAVDVFVYDTSLDSDGGAWRKRCQHTSWYNETLNTSTRGSRREFPSVAVIVAEATKVTIYDGDDPSLPMWMVFQGGYNNLVALGSGYFFTSACVKNGVLAVGHADGARAGLDVVNFITDAGKHYGTTEHPLNVAYGSAAYKGNIAQRNAALGNVYVGNIGLIANNTVNDVAITVLPDAPTDPATGLPVPTIAVATGVTGSAGGAGSVIKHEGTVVDLIASTGAGGYMSDAVAFDADGRLIIKHSWGAGAYGTLYVFDQLPDADEAYRFPSAREYNGSALPRLVSDHAVTSNGHNYINKFVAAGDHIAIQTTANENTTGRRGLTLLSENPEAKDFGMAAHMCATYNSGWLHGDIKLAALADIQTSALDASELVGDGDFTGTGAWNVLPNATISGGQLTLADVSASRAEQTGFSVEPGSALEVTIDIDAASTGTCRIEFNGASGWTIPHPTLLGVGVHNFLIGLPNHFKNGIRIIRQTGAVVVNSISVKAAAPNRFGEPLAVTGTITRSPVATGADLVGYSGFSASNYLETSLSDMPSSNTDELCMMGWFKPPNGATGIFVGLDIPTSASSGVGVFGITTGWTNGSSGAWAERGTNVGSGFGKTTVIPNQWQHVAAIRRSTGTSLYINGKLESSTTQALATSASPTLRVGGALDGSGSNSLGYMALLRISATAPTADQIAKIYEDERKLFQPGAQCTLYGTSDAVTALAHDPKTNLLHVGTSAGRSTLDGLQRVANTETPVGTAISAVNGLIAEE